MDYILFILFLLGCNFMSSGQKCRSENYATCEERAVCTGKQAECPKSEPMPDGRGCIERGQCRAGECIPYCETQGKQIHHQLFVYNILILKKN